MYSDISTLIREFSEPNTASERAFESSVFPTPVGPKNIKEPMGLLGSLIPTLPRLIAFATAVTASSCPTTLSWSMLSRFFILSLSSCESLFTGILVHPDTTSAISSSVTVRSNLSFSSRQAVSSFSSFFFFRSCFLFISPAFEKSIKGCKDAFVETLRTNTSLIRRRLRTPELKIEQRVAGRLSGTSVALLYIEGVAQGSVVDEALRRLGELDIDGLLAAGDLEEYIVDSPRSPLPQLIHTERPDTFAIHLLDGRVGILVDGLPLGFLLPADLAAFLRVPEDSAMHFAVASMLTLLRWAALAISLLLPAAFVAVSMYHQEMLPVKLLLSMTAAKQYVPFGVAAEVIAMLLAFELLQEAGLRLPDPVGQTASIIGALIVGQSAVEAKVVSPIAVIVVALAGISGYTMPSQDLGGAVRLGRLALVAAAALLGLYGVVALAALMIWYTAGLESFGKPYTAPFTGADSGALVRVLLKRPNRANKLRGAQLAGWNRRRQR